MERAQTEDGKQPEDMQRLLATNGTVKVTNFCPPAPGKKNGGKVLERPDGLNAHLRRLASLLAFC